MKLKSNDIRHGLISGVEVISKAKHPPVSNMYSFSPGQKVRNQMILSQNDTTKYLV
jgi:hypothetical protein